jgi:dihydroxyacetone kinase DhaKLM complex PTS-EIIA-like component DhaM
MSFRTGVRQLRFTDSSGNIVKNELTYSENSFESRGTIEWKEKTILSTKTAEIASAQVSETWTVNTTRQAVGSDTGWYDPLAQTFLVDVDGGVFITDLDLFFSSKDTALPVKVEIRNVVNGYPGPVIVPFSTSIKYPSAITVDAIRGSVATKFKFTSPIYLQANTEYCVCIFADSAKYKLWVAQSGEIDVNGSGLISGQPYMGVLFKSQNASTWTADQSQDLKFQLNRALFDIASTATIDLVNQHTVSNRYYDVVQANVGNIILSNTNISTKYLDDNSTNINVELGENVYFTSPKLIKSAVNEAGTPSLRIRMDMSSNNINVSPVIDLSRCSATLTSNVIEASVVDNEIYSDVGTATAKYVTKQINLNDSATTLRIMFSANVPNLTNTDVLVYYKVGDSASTEFATVPYILATAAKAYTKTQNSRLFTDTEYLIENMNPFNSIRVKLVFKSDNTSQVPRVKDLRVLAYA